MTHLNLEWISKFAIIIKTSFFDFVIMLDGKEGT